MSQQPKKQNIQVYVRLRPFNKQEKENHSQLAIEIAGTKDVLIRQQHGKKYAFDRVFDMFSRQSEVYAYVCQPMIKEVLMGYNCTVFAYGQTGTGKTYTMEGNLDEKSQMNQEYGVILHAIADLYDNLLMSGQEHSVRISYMELYNEEIFDLLSEESRSLRIFEDQKQKGSVIISDLEEVIVNNASEVKKVLLKGAEKRRTAETFMNQKSSRSHAVFTVTVHIRETTDDGEEVMKIGKINFVDLAGSENIGRSGAVEKRAREAGNINQSLLTLGRVIKALTEKSLHIPYRESKLTRILQDSLGGKTKTSIIATISPVTTSLEETLSTLDYANRARRITNKPEINQRMSKRMLLNQYTEEIERLQRDLMASRSGNGVVLDEDNYQRLMHEHDMRKQELTNRITQIRDLEGRIADAEIMKGAIESDFLKCKSSLDDMHSKYRESTEKHQELLDYVTERGEILQKQATKLLKVADSSTKNENILIDKLKKAYIVSDNTNVNISDIIHKQRLINEAYATEMDSLQSENIQRMQESFDDFSRKRLIDSNYFDSVSSEHAHLMQTRQMLQKDIESIMLETEEKLSECEVNNKIDSIHDILDVTKKAIDETIIVEFGKFYDRIRDNVVEKRDALQKAAKNLQSMKEHNEKTLQNIICMTNTLQTNIEYVTNIFKRSYEIIQQQESQEADLKKDFMALMEKYGRFNDSSDERRQSLIQNISNISNMYNNVNENLNSSVSNIKCSSETCVNLTEENLESNKSSVTALKNLEATLNEFRLKSDQMANVVYEKTHETVSVTEDCIRDNFNSLISTNENCLGKVNYIMEEQIEDILNNYETRLVNVKDKMKFELDFVSDIQKQIDEKQKIEENLQVTSNKMLNDIKMTLIDLEGKIILPRPSGDTPVKKVQNYPRRLASVVPVNLNSESDIQNDFSIVEEESIQCNENRDSLNISN